MTEVSNERLPVVTLDRLEEICRVYTAWNKPDQEKLALAQELLSIRQSHSTGVVAWICDGCGRLSKDPQGDLHALRVSGALSCCPERKLLPLYTHPKEAEVTVTEEMVERAMGAFIEEVRRQDGEWTDDFDEERLLTSPSGDWFAPFFPIRAALVAALSRKG